MIFDFRYPLALLALLPAAGIVIGIYFRYHRQNGSCRSNDRDFVRSSDRSNDQNFVRSDGGNRTHGHSKNGSRGRGSRRLILRGRALSAPLVLRLMVLILLVLSLAGLEIRTLAEDTEVIFVADLSDSTLSKQKETADFIASSMELLPDHYRAGIVSFGENALVEQAMGVPGNFHGFHSRPVTYYSNIDGALQRAEGLFSFDGRKRIVVLTDGAENMGDGIMRANALRQRNIRVDGVFLDMVPTREVQLSALVLPAALYQGEDYDIRVEIDSTVETKGTLRLFADRVPAGTREVQIQKGKNVFLFRETAERTGTIVYEAELELASSDDTFRPNNRMASFVRIDGPPVVALVEGQEGEGRELAKIMEAGGLEYRLFTPHTLPNRLEELIKYDAVILSNVGYDDLGEEETGLLDDYVKSMGKGLLVTGGDNSYALGGYLGTKLEEILPVDMDLSKKKDIPSLALVLVIDKSGSMSDGQYGISKMDLAKEAAIRSLEALRETDSIGVVGFDSAASWVVETQRAKNRTEIRDTIGTLQPGGGTNLYPGLNSAFQSLKDTDAALKHVIVLTDGHTQGGNFDGLVREMANAGITVSGVAVGKDSDLTLMERLAETGNGRYYFTDEFSSIPKIFTKETYMATRSYINNETFFPKARGDSPVLSGIDAVPSLDGYITTTIKGGAISVLVSDRDDDPVLAYWDYGLGKVAAWTSDAKGIWTEDWLKWDKASAFWLNTISSVLPGNSGENGSIEVNRSGNQGQVSITTDQPEKGQDASATIVSPDGKETRIKLKPSKPGYFQGNFDLEETGVYLVRAEQQQGEGSAVWETGLVYPYSPEYDIRTSSSKNLLEHIVGQTGGRILQKPEDLLLDTFPPVWKHHEVWPVLLPLALLLFFLDIALRKLGGKFIAEKLFLPVIGWIGRLPAFSSIRNRRIMDAFRRTQTSPVEEKKGSQQLPDIGKRQSEQSAEAGKQPSKEPEMRQSSDFTSILLEARRKNKKKK